jgi:hypothetical protein
MSDESEVMMPTTKSDALQHIEITVLRQMGDNIAAQTRHLEALSSKVDDVRERVIRIEARETEKEVEDLARRVASLEEKNHRVSGVTAFGAWIAQSAPWLVAVGAFILYIIGLKK